MEKRNSTKLAVARTKSKEILITIYILIKILDFEKKEIA